METVLGLLDPSLDSYVSQAEFLKPNRRVVNLLRLSLSYIDLDIYNSSDFSHLKNYAPESVAEFLNVLKHFQTFFWLELRKSRGYLYRDSNLFRLMMRSIIGLRFIPIRV
jgi:hypothetical protein